MNRLPAAWGGGIIGTGDRMGRLVIPALAVATAATTLAVGSIAGRTPAAFAASALAATAALVIILLIRRAPVAAFGLLFLVASLSGLTIDLPVGRVRLEQPAILGSFVALAMLGRLGTLRDRSVVAVGACFCLYLAVMVLSSVLKAPVLAVSLRLLIWTAISMISAVVAYALLAGHPGEEQRSLSWIGALQGIAGFAVAGLFLLAGPLGIPGMQVNPGEVPKVASIDYEANLFASLLAMLAPFAIEEWRRRRTALSGAILVITIAALGLGVTRGAYLGLAGGLLAYFGLLAVYRVPRTSLAPLVALTAVALLLAPAASFALLPVARPATTGVSGTSTPQPTPQPTPVADTLAYRLDHVPTALADIRTSPIIGLGTAAYGQHHVLSNGSLDYIGTLALVAVYESGIVGAFALGVGFLLLLAMLGRGGGATSRDIGNVGRAAAYAGSITSFLVSYQATNALWFSINWLIIGAALAFVASGRLNRVNRGQVAFER